MANLIPSNTAAAPSPEFIVTGPTHLHCFPTDGSAYVGRVMVKNSDGTFSRFKASNAPGKPATEVYLDQINPSCLIVAPGTYIFEKDATPVAIAIDIEA